MSTSTLTSKTATKPVKKARSAKRPSTSKTKVAKKSPVTKKTASKAPIKKRTKSPARTKKPSANTKTGTKSPRKAKKVVTTDKATAAAQKLKQTGALHMKRHPLGHLLLEKKLHEAGFRGGISTDRHLLDVYSTDESIFSIRPQVVIQPKTQTDINIATKIIAVETKNFTSLSLTPRAAGTGLSGGSLTDSVIIDVCAHLDTIGHITHHHDEVHITVEPGVMWRNMEKKLKHIGYYVPSYTSSKDIASVGGAVGNNSAGAETLKYGHCADWITSLEIVLHDGETYTVSPLTFDQYKKAIKQKNAYAAILQSLFTILETNEKEIQKNRPKTQKNTAGYNLWDIIPDGVAAFKKGKSIMNPLKLIAGSQGTIGIVSSITMRAIPLPHHTTLMCVPVYDLQEASRLIAKAKVYNPLNMEIFDDRTFDLALQNPQFFKRYHTGLPYYRAMLALYSMYHVRFQRTLPEYFIMITLDEETTRRVPAQQIARTISYGKTQARVIYNPIEEEVLWNIRRSSYTLSKLQDDARRPAAFLEDMTVPIDQLPTFLTRIKRLFQEFNIKATVHGHAGDGHFHFYPLLDFTNKTTPALILKMSERFFATAIDCGGTICGEHNDGIIRTTYHAKMFTKPMLKLFAEVEALFDPDDIFNPGKKVNPRFDIKTSIRTKN